MGKNSFEGCEVERCRVYFSEDRQKTEGQKAEGTQNFIVYYKLINVIMQYNNNDCISLMIIIVYT